MEALGDESHQRTVKVQWWLKRRGLFTVDPALPIPQTETCNNGKVVLAIRKVRIGYL